MEAKEAPIPAARARALRGRARFRRRTPLRPVAPTMIGRAIVRESRFAWLRVKRRQRAAARVTPLRETPGREGRGLGQAERQPVCGGRFPAAAPLGTAVGDDHRGRAGEQAERGRPRPAEPSLDLAARGRSPPTAAGQKREGEQRRLAEVEGAQLIGDHAALADQQGRGGAGMECHLEALPQLRVDRVPVPARQPGDEDDVGGAGDRQQLGRALDDAEQDRRRAGTSRRSRPEGSPPVRRIGRSP